mmetsp:Transcript_2717/g.5880  ORF Transcript_2717/g.5880 Transcript_2717/m.5880 type:complete len:1287 (+) Transcript_2717:156-4016(+)
MAETTPLLGSGNANAGNVRRTSTDGTFGFRGESSSLMSAASTSSYLVQDYGNNNSSLRRQVYDFLEAKTNSGKLYEVFMISLILLNVFCFIVGSLFVEEYNPSENVIICDDICDAIWFGNYRNNGLQFVGVGATSVLELFTIAVFTVEYILRLWTCDLESPTYSGWMGRLRYLPTFFSVVDLVSTVPFYIDAFILTKTDMASSAFLRMFRLFRMMRVEGRYDSALTLIGDVYNAQKAILGTAMFVGATTWVAVSSLYYLVERKNPKMIYCGAAPDYCQEDMVDADDTSECIIDSWGIVDCSAAGCPPTEEYPEPCYSLYQSIPSSSYYSLLNLFGEYPLIDQHGVGGQIVGTLTAILAVGVFGVAAGVVGNGFEEQVEKRAQLEDAEPIVERGLRTPGFVGNSSTFKGGLYNLMSGSVVFDWFINFLVIGSALTFAIDTIDELPNGYRTLATCFEWFTVVVFTLEYIFRLYSITADPMYPTAGSLLTYATSFTPLTDLISFLPFWIVLCSTGSIAISGSLTWLKVLRLFRIFRFEKYTHAFTSFDDVMSRNFDVLSVTLYAALMLWVFFGALLYFTERDNPDSEMAENYKHIPNSMWVTLLNLSGEAPLAQYSVAGKILTGILGLFATAIFGIPIGILGAGFEEVVAEENQDDERELARDESPPSQHDLLGSQFERSCYNVVNGYGSAFGKAIESAIYILIFTAIFIGAVQTVEGHESDFSQIEAFCVYAFTAEYIIRFIGAGAEPAFRMGTNGFMARVKYFCSFYSVIDLLAILPYYLAVAFPGSIIDQNDEYLRMSRILRLLKLDKYIPSISLIDDVIRYKWASLRVAGYAAITLWLMYAGFLYLFEYHDDANDLDNPVPIYGCYEDCSMMDRFRNYFDSIYYTGVHLTGDFPIITYTWPARFTQFFIVVTAVGVVSIPSGLIASGFVDIVQSRNKAKNNPIPGGMAGDDWYEIKYRSLEGVPPPPSRFGTDMDIWQNAVNDFLNGTKDASGHHRYTPFAYAGRVFIFTVIILNIVAVMAESIPSIDKRVGNDPGNFFDIFEAFSVGVFAIEYACRLFCAPKNREALYSPWVYAGTFFGIVDALSTFPWFIEQGLILAGVISAGGDVAMVFRIFRVFRILQLEDFVTAFSKLDNVFRASKDVLKATGLMALIIWIGGAALFYIFESDNPNWRTCDDSIPPIWNGTDPGCFDFASTAECNEYYPGGCDQAVFVNYFNSAFLCAVFLGGEWGVIDFTYAGRLVCMFYCIIGIALYAIPVGTLFDSFGAVLGMDGDDDDDEEEDEEE